MNQEQIQGQYMVPTMLSLETTSTGASRVLCVIATPNGSTATHIGIDYHPEIGLPGLSRALKQLADLILIANLYPDRLDDTISQGGNNDEDPDRDPDGTDPDSGLRQQAEPESDPLRASRS